MKPFKYSLQAVQTLRERQERAALHDYGQALRLVEEAKERMESVRQELEAVWAEFGQKVSTRTAAQQLVQLQAYAQSIEVRRGECEQALKQSWNKAQEAFAKLLSARQASAVLEKHFENQKRRHDRERRRWEQKFLDDLAGRRNASPAVQAAKRGSIWN